MKKLILLIIFALIFSSCNGGSGPAVAQVNGHKIYASDVTNTMAQESDKYDSALKASAKARLQLAQLVVQELIQEEILLGEASKLKLSATSKDLDEELKIHFGTDNRSKIKDILKEHNVDPAYWLKQQKNKISIRKLIDKEVVQKIPVSDEEIRKYYAEHENDFHVPMQYNARQILVNDRALADEIAAKLAKGESFEMLAKKYSMSPDSSRGGDLGFFSARDFPQVFSDICSELKPGETSEVKETDYGFQIFQLIDKKPPRTLTLDEARQTITEEIREKQSAEAFAKWFDELRRNSSIAVYEDALKKLEGDKS